jgi:hypothetical protein
MDRPAPTPDDWGGRGPERLDGDVLICSWRTTARLRTRMPLGRHRKSPPVSQTPLDGAGSNGGRSHSSAPVDWSAFLRRVERKRRLLGRLPGGEHVAPADDYYVRATYASFRLDGLEVEEAEVREALECGAERPILRSRQDQRLRGHAAILHHIETDLRKGLSLTTDGVVRWYTGISAGLSTTGLNQATSARLDEVVRRINSPQMRIQPALRDIAATHTKLLADPLVPAFNGILARLLLRYHLGRCKLPAVVFDAETDRRLTSGEGMVRRLVELLERSYDQLLGRKG